MSMLSGRLVHLIESHHRQISERILREIQRNPDFPHLQALSETELRERCQTILANLGECLSERRAEIARKQEAVGKLRFEQSVPLHEAVEALFLIKNQMIDFLEEQGIARDTVSLYAEEELEHRVGRFFDAMVLHLIRGYEGAWQKARRTAA